jgi:hypothetical protein
MPDGTVIIPTVLQIQNTVVLEETAYFLIEIGLLLPCSTSANWKEANLWEHSFAEKLQL